MTTQEFLEKYYGARVHTDELALNTSILTTFTQICPNDPSRVHFFISNVGTNDLYIYTDETVSTSKGILVPKSGGIVTFKAPDHGDFPTKQWFGVGSGGSTTILFGSTRLF